MHQENMSVYYISPYTPLLYSKTGVCRGITIFLIFASKHRLWVLVRTASARRFLRVPTIYVLSKNKKNIIFSDEIFNFFILKNLCILHGQVFVMNVSVCFSDSWRTCHRDKRPSERKYLRIPNVSNLCS